jgi:hypothetical protein
LSHVALNRFFVEDELQFIKFSLCQTMSVSKPLSKVIEFSVSTWSAENGLQIGKNLSVGTSQANLSLSEFRNNFNQVLDSGGNRRLPVIMRAINETRIYGSFC